MGVLSERDILRALAERGAVVLKEPVSQVMKVLASDISPMTTGKFRHVPVLEQDRLTGIVSIGDVVRHRLMEMEHESEALKDEHTEEKDNAA
jgi:CBS domain-containing protein